MGSQAQYLSAAAVLFLVLFGNNAPTPLYPIWQQEFDLSTAAITGIHSTYPLGTILGLLYGGKLADQVGRRPILLIAMLCGIAGAGLLLLSESLTPLLAARLLNGVATGLASGPVVAAMVELEPYGNHARASWAGALITMVSASCGMFAATMIVWIAGMQLALALPFLIQLGLYGLAFILVVRLRETLPARSQKRWREADFAPRTIAIPAAVRVEFGIAAGTAFASWGLVGLWLGMAPTLVAVSLGTADIVHGGIAASIVLACSGATQIASYKLIDRISIVAGLVLTILALGAMAVFLAYPQLLTLYLAALLSGIGQGLAWQGSVRLINRISPVDQRAEAISALYIVVYAGVMLIFGVGLLADQVGVMEAVASLLVTLAILCAVIVWAGSKDRLGP